MSDHEESSPPITEAQERNNRQKKVLMISYAFPPGTGSAVQRPLKFIKFLPDFGWTPYIVTPQKYMEPLDYSFTKDIPNGASVNEVFSLEPANLEAILRKRHELGSIGKIGYQSLGVILKIYSVIYYRTYIVDCQDGWVPFGLIRAKQLIKKEDIDLIFVDMEPPSSSLIGLFLKKMTTKPLVIDYHDPWTTSVYSRKSSGIRQRVAEYLEHKILSVAEKVTAGKTLIITEIKGKFSDIDQRKFLTIHSGYDPDDFTDLQQNTASKFTITYTGKLSEKFYYSPETFLRALGELIEEKKIPRDDVKAIFVGTVSLNYKHRFNRLLKHLSLEDVVISAGQVDHKRCAEYQMSSDVLLYIIESLEGKNVSYGFSGALPSKLYEYFYTGNPILAIVPPGFEADLIEKTRTGFVVEPNNVTAVKNMLYDLYQKYKNNELIMDPNREEINKYDRESLTGELAAVLDDILQKTNY